MAAESTDKTSVITLMQARHNSHSTGRCWLVIALFVYHRQVQGKGVNMCVRQPACILCTVMRINIFVQLMNVCMCEGGR